MGYDQYVSLTITSKNKEFLQTLTEALQDWLCTPSFDEDKEHPGTFYLQINDNGRHVYEGDGVLEGVGDKAKELFPEAYLETTTTYGEGEPWKYVDTSRHFDLEKLAASYPVETIDLEYQGEESDDAEQFIVRRNEDPQVRLLTREWTEKWVRPLPTRV